MTEQPTSDGKLLELAEAEAKLKATGMTEYGIDCLFRTAPDGTFCHAFLYEDGQWRFATGGHPVYGRTGATIQCIYMMPLTPLTRAHTLSGDQ